MSDEFQNIDNTSYNQTYEEEERKLVTDEFEFTDNQNEGGQYQNQQDFGDGGTSDSEYDFIGDSQNQASEEHLDTQIDEYQMTAAGSDSVPSSPRTKSSNSLQFNDGQMEL